MIDSFEIKDIQYELGEESINLLNEYPNSVNLIDKTGIFTVYKSNVNIIDFAAKPLSSLLNKNNDIKIQCLITVTQSHNYFLPGLSSFILNKLNMDKDIYCIDTNQGCSGFAHALYLASKLLCDFDNIVILCADKYRSKLCIDDRSTNSVFSDCSSATLVVKNENGLRIKNKSYSFDGTRVSYLYQSIDDGLNNGFLHMSGPELWAYTRSQILPNIRIMIQNGNIEYLYLHQASKLVFEGIKSGLNASIKMPYNYNKYGNTVSSSLPLLISENLIYFNKSPSLLAGFGVGLNSMMLELGVE
ncbi:MAG: hypothetical protein K9G11_03330 [Rickettsiaceae bacterium]|nr:hypothetical protein [Rickettsiaceae bacterium]